MSDKLKLDGDMLQLTDPPPKRYQKVICISGDALDSSSHDKEEQEQ